MIAQNPPRFLDKSKDNFLKRGFITADSSPGNKDPFAIIQDPTFLSFKVEFFTEGAPGNGNDLDSYYLTDMHLMHAFSHNCLLRSPKFSSTQNTNNDTDTSPTQPSFVEKTTPSDYGFDDSAEDYLFSIGSVNRLGHLRSFKQLLWRLQEETPWYFQKITGADSLYTLDPGVNVKKDMKLTFECLESVDMRTSLLADLYRLSAFDFERHREVLPQNMRTFKMRIHVFEMRNFNTTTGRIAQVLTGVAQDNYEQKIKSAVNGGTSTTLTESAFDAISMQTYELGLCEFDFYTQAPDYMSELSVAEVPQATFKFNINVGTVRKTGKYTFYRYLTDYAIRENRFPGTTGVNDFVDSLKAGNPSVPYAFYDPFVNYTSLRPYDPNFNRDPTLSEDLRDKFRQESDLNMNPNILGNYRRNRVGGVLGRVLGAAESALGTAVNRLVGRVNSVLLGNAYDNIPSPAEVGSALLGFINPDLRPNAGSSANPDDNIVGQGGFDPLSKSTTLQTSPMQSLSVDTKITDSPKQPLPVDKTISKGGFDPLSKNTTISKTPKGTLPVDKKISGGGFSSLNVNTQISPVKFDPLSTPRSIEGGGFDSLDTTSEVEGGGFDSLPVSSEISKDSLNPLQVSSTIEQLSTDSLDVDSSIIPSSLEGQETSREILQSPKILLEVPGAISQSPFEQISLVSNIERNPMEVSTVSTEILQSAPDSISVSSVISPLERGQAPAIDNTIIPGESQTIQIDSEISKITLEGSSPERIISQSPMQNPNFADTNIVQSRMQSLSVDSEIIGLKFEETPVDKNLLENPIVESTITNVISPLKINENEVSKEIPKNVDFEEAPKQPSINPRNVYRNF
jgi:hypothetical protein